MDIAKIAVAEVPGAVRGFAEHLKVNAAEIDHNIAASFIPVEADQCEIASAELKLFDPRYIGDRGKCVGLMAAHYFGCEPSLRNYVPMSDAECG